MGTEIVEFSNLDAGYEKVHDFYTYVKASGRVNLKSLEEVITGLTAHWTGNDATKHINSLINIYKSLAGYVDGLVALLSKTSECVVATQKVRHANGGEGLVGDVDPVTVYEQTSFALLSETNKFFADPLVKEDFNAYTNFLTYFDNYMSKVEQLRDELMAIWISGANKSQVMTGSTEFIEAGNTFKTGTLTEVKENLNTVVNNLNQVQL